DRPRETPERAHETHGLRKPRSFSVEHGLGALRREVARTKPCTSRGDDEPDEAVAQRAQRGRYRFDTVAHDLTIDDGEARPFERVDEGVARLVLARTADDAIRHGQHLGEKLSHRRATVTATGPFRPCLRIAGAARLPGPTVATDSRAGRGARAPDV